MENAVRRLPALEKAEIVTLLNGPEGFTPDGESLLGPTPVPGFWVAAAFCAHGLAMAGAAGKTLAEWIVDGHPEWDTWHLDLRRFNSNYSSQSYNLARAAETYSRYYAIRYPYEERQSARKLRLSPIYSRLEENGAEFGEKAGWERANWFRKNEASASHGHVPSGWARYYWSPAIGVECLATRQSAAIYDLTSFGKIEVQGPGSTQFLQRICANNIERKVSSVIYTSVLNPRGGIECDYTVTRLGQDHYLIVTGTSLLNHNISYLRSHLPDDGSVIVQDVSSAYTCIGMWGPESREILRNTTTEDVSDKSFPYLTMKKITIGNVPVTALRVTYVGELGWEFYCPAEYGLQLWDTLWSAGEVFGIVPAGYRAIDSLRLEKGYRLWGVDISPDYTPLEAGLEFAVNFNKGDFQGRDALLRQKNEGIKQKLCCLVLEDSTAIAIGSEPVRLRKEKEVIGWVTGGGFGYTVGKSIAYSYLPPAHTETGTWLDIELLGEQVPAVIQPEPLWDPENTRVRHS
jgi:4-methylaminobutanoate oxidase (formaldehyde-forming)